MSGRWSESGKIKLRQDLFDPDQKREKPNVESTRFGTPKLEDVNVGLRSGESGERRFVPGEVHLLTIKHNQSALTQPAIRFNSVGVERVRQME